MERHVWLKLLTRVEALPSGISVTITMEGVLWMLEIIPSASVGRDTPLYKRITLLSAMTSRSVGWEYPDVHTDVRTPGEDLPVPAPRGTPWTLTERSVKVVLIWGDGEGTV